MRSSRMCACRDVSTPGGMRHLQHRTNCLQEADREVDALLFSGGQTIPPLTELVGELDRPGHTLPEYVTDGIMSSTVYVWRSPLQRPVDGSQHFRDAFFQALLVGPALHFGVERGLIWIVDSSKCREVSGPRFAVQALGIARLADFQRGVDIYLDEVADGSAHLVPHVAVRRDGRRQRNHAVARQQARYEADAADVLVAILAREAQALAEVLAHRVAIQQFQAASARGEPLIHGAAERGLARCAETDRK